MKTVTTRSPIFVHSFRFRAGALILALAAGPVLAQSSPPPTTASKAEVEAAKNKLEQLQREQQALLEKLDGSRGKVDPRFLREEAEIAKRIAEEKNRPRYGYITPSTREPEVAAYYKRFASHVECVAYKNYPPEAKGRTYKAIATVSVQADGTMEGVSIEMPSGAPDVDAAITRVAKQAAPFDSFSPEIRARYDALRITSTWTFAPMKEGDKPPGGC